jgi:hypothetical protein
MAYTCFHQHLLKKTGGCLENANLKDEEEHEVKLCSSVIVIVVVLVPVI